MAKLARHVFATLVTLLFVFLWLSAGDHDPVASWMALGERIQKRVAMGAVSGPAGLRVGAKPAERPALTELLASIVG
jgi:hypothetical protein